MSKNNFDRLYEELKNKFVFENALNTIKTLLLNPNATHEDYKKHLHLVELIEEHEDEVKDSELYNEVVELLDTDKVSLDSIQTVLLEDLKKLKSSTPTEKQKEAGNYKKHKIKLKGRLITIENIAGSTRSNIDSDGKRWTTKMKDHYGYFNGTLGADGDHVDVFVNSEANSKEIEARKAYVITQNDIITKEFDEHKYILGATSKEHAKQIYLRNYSKDYKGFGGVDEVSDLDLSLDSQTKTNRGKK